MLNQISIGIYEYSVLKAIQALKEDAYGTEIIRYMSQRLNNTVVTSQVYGCLKRLKSRGFIAPKAVVISSGKATVVYVIKPEGNKIVKEINAYLDSLNS